VDRGVAGLARHQRTQPGRARLLHVRGELLSWQRDTQSARACLEESLAISRAIGDTTLTAYALSTLATVVIEEDTDAARRMQEESIASFEALGDTFGVIQSRGVLAACATRAGDTATAQRLHQTTVDQARASGQPWLAGAALYSLALLRMRERAYPAAQELLKDSLQQFRVYGHTTNEATVLGMLGLALLLQGRHEEALPHLTDALVLHQRTGRSGDLADVLEMIAGLVARQSQAARAARLFGAADALRQAHGLRRQRTFEGLHAATVGAVRSSLGEEPFASAYAEGRTLSLDAAVAFALEQTYAPSIETSQVQTS
jgi:tetratricopeptide (TPR) repeat protein